MYKGNRSKLFPIIVIIVIIAIVVFGVVSLIRFFLGGSSTETDKTDTSTVSSKLLDTSTSRSVQMIVRGPIVSDENFRSFQVTISPQNRSIIAWRGYDKTHVVAEKTYANDSEAYTQFVNALSYAGFTKTNTITSDDTDGLCANGKVYNFAIMDAGSSVDNRWTTNCGVRGSFGGSGAPIRQLFLNQIPDAEAITTAVNI